MAAIVLVLTPASILLSTLLSSRSEKHFYSMFTESGNLNACLLYTSLGKDNNLFVVSTILVTGIGGLSLTFGEITITPVAVALILGILANQILKGRSANRD